MSGIHHSAIVTGDVERSTKFWRDGLGLTEWFDTSGVELIGPPR